MPSSSVQVSLQGLCVNFASFALVCLLDVASTPASTSALDNEEEEERLSMQRRGHCKPVRHTSGANTTKGKKDVTTDKKDVVMECCSCAWCVMVWPEIKRKIVVTLKLAQTKVTPRPKSFELLGYDVIIDDSLTPWILEVNMSPAM